MKRRFLPMLLLMLIGMAGNVKALAQVPEPDGQWTFSNPEDLMAASKGSLQLVPAVLGTPGIETVATASEAGITAAGDGVVFVPKTAAFKLERAEGAEATLSYTFMMDLKVPDAYVYDAIFQTNGSNANDAELFISKGQIGLGTYLGGYYGRIWNDTWYRLIFTMSEGYAKLYVNGKKVINFETSDGRFELDPWGFYLLCDEDGEASDTYVSEVAFWETPLTEEQVAAMEVPVPDPWIKSVSQIQEGDQFYIISDRGKFNGTSTAKPKAMASQQESFPTTWGEKYVYWGDLDKESDGFVWTAEKAGDQWAFLNKENGKYIGNMNDGENDVIFSDSPVGYTLTDLAEDEGNFYMTNEESEHSLHVQGYLRGDRGSNSLAKQEVGDDDYESAEAPRNGYPGRWHFVKIGGDAPVETGMKIATAEDFADFAAAVEAGENTLEAYLAADIELTGNVMVGAYAGTFDGKGHKITYNYTEVGDHCGLFKTLADGATIRNLYVEGTAVVKGIHYGALAGDYAGNVLVENVVTNVDITGDRTSVTGDGGMAGYVDGNVTFNNCATLGKMGNEGTSMYCGFVAFATNAATSTLNNCYTTCELTEGTGTSYCYTFCRGTATLNNCYYLNAIGEVQGTAVTEDKFATGEFCYMLNGDQTTIGWYQTLGEDALPVPFDSSKQVYANGELKCDGTSAGGELTYSNSATSTIPPHNFEGGWCTVCGTWDANYLTPDDSDYYRIATAKDLAWVAELIAQGNPQVDVKLTADVDITEYPDLMIATETNQFAGIFDGQGYTITYNYPSVTEKWRGLFRAVNGAVIRNLYVKGSATVTNIHYGALIGVAYGTVLVENVVTDVDITGKSSTGVQGDAGMLGANYADITFNNCATLGEMGYEGTSMYSPFSGWSHGDSKTTLNNCYSTCKLTEGTGTGNCFTLTHQSGTVTINNSYYLNLIGTLVGGTQIAAEQIASGELCYKLNGDQSDICWYQTLGEDAGPIPFSSHKQVYATGAVRCDGTPIPDSPLVYTNTEGSIEWPPHQFGEDGICTVCGSPKENADGFLLIANAQQLNWFAEKVADGRTDLKATLTADINLAESDYPDLMIGTEANPFAGIFDGAGYTITYNYTVADKWRGLFAFVKDAIIQNLIVEGSAYVTNIHYGALIGRADGIVIVENVITNVDITGARSGVTGDGGMLGANYADITFNNCATLGKMGYEGSSMYSSFSAWSNGGSSTTLNNCYSLCELTEGTGEGNCFTLTHKSGTVTINNSYYLNLIGTYVGGTQITAEQVANGELCDMLGAGWYQNIGEDAYPVFDKTHNVVKVITDAGYATMYIPDAVDVPEGVEAFTGEFKEENCLELIPVGATVPGWEPVVLKGEAGIYSFKPATPTEVTAEIAFADLGFENADNLDTFDVGDLTFSFDLGTNANGNTPKYYDSGSAARIYAGNTMTISAVGPITKIEFTFTGPNYAIKSDAYEFSDGSYALSTKTWTGSTESLTLTNIGSSQIRIVSIVVTYAGYPDNIAGNVLKGADQDTDAIGKYVLAKPEGKPAGFYEATSGTIKAGKAYIEITDYPYVKAFLFEGDNADGIETIDNEQIAIDNKAIYNLAGQRINKMQKGINIVNGKKILK